MQIYRGLWRKGQCSEQSRERPYSIEIKGWSYNKKQKGMLHGETGRTERYRRYTVTQSFESCSTLTKQTENKYHKKKKYCDIFKRQISLKIKGSFFFKWSSSLLYSKEPPGRSCIMQQELSWVAFCYGNRTKIFNGLLWKKIGGKSIKLCSPSCIHHHYNHTQMLFNGLLKR